MRTHRSSDKLPVDLYIWKYTVFSWPVAYLISLPVTIVFASYISKRSGYSFVEWDFM